MHDSNPLIGQFLTYLIDERHFSPYTSRCYGLDLRQFAEYLTAEHSIEVVGSQLRAMMPWIAKNKLVDQTRN